MAKMPSNPLNIANMLAAIAHNKSRRSTAKNYPGDMENSDSDHMQNADPSTEAVSGHKKSPKQVVALKYKENQPNPGKDNPGKPSHNPPGNPQNKASGFKGKQPAKPYKGSF